MVIGEERCRSEHREGFCERMRAERRGEERMNGKQQDGVRMYVVRHAEHVTPALAHLSRKGSLQAVAIAQTLKRKRQLAAVYSSPRSIETARNISKELDVGISLDKRLLPFNGGKLIGWSLNKVQQEMPEVYQKRFVERNPDYKVPDGESLNDRFLRVKNFLEEMVTKHHGQQIVVVTHGGIIDDMFRNARSLPPTQLTGLKKPYGSLSVLVFKDGKFEEELWGGVDHLPQAVAESPTGGHLYLFPHQVAGSFPMLRGDLGELCKPATKAELETYEVLQKECSEVAKFAPTFLGRVVIDVMHLLKNGQALSTPQDLIHSPEQEMESKDHDAMEEDTENHDPHTVAIGNSSHDFGTPFETASTNLSNSNCVSRSSPLATTRDSYLSKRRRSPSNFGDTECKKLRSEEEETAMADTASLGSAGSNAGDTEAATATETNCSEMMQIEGGNRLGCAESGNDAEGRPWSVNTLWDRFIQHRKKKAVEVGEGKFVYLVMENLTHGLSRPQILDLKMGTQQHGSFESDEKKAKKQMRVETTTSKSLGVRIGGMQIYDESEHAYVLRDKYWGRSLDQQGLYNAIRLFVTEQKPQCSEHEFMTIRANVVKDIITQLDKLEQAIKSTCWRFYGCSILIVFDGAMSSSRRDRVSSSSSVQSDESIQSNPEMSSAMDIATMQHPLIQQHRLSKQLSFRTRSHSFDQSTGETDKNHAYCVSVRLIDFAKCERHTAGNSYDAGMVFGIQNLRKIFSKVLLDAPCTHLSRTESACAFSISGAL